MAIVGERMKKVLIIFGTRPEAIKMVPLIYALQREHQHFHLSVCVTAQHREMLDQVLSLFEIEPEYDLDMMKPHQDLYTITSEILVGLKEVLLDCQPDIVLVHGDTTTTFSASLASFYQHIPVGHIEAGLRTHQRYSPFPEEANRKLTSVLATYHFAPTFSAKENLAKEGITEGVVVTGNTVIDTLFLMLEKIDNEPLLKERILLNLQTSGLLFDVTKESFILVTGHRRESFGEGFLNICYALKEIAQRYESIRIIYPVHLNPQVQKPVYEILDGIENISLISPLEYPEFIYLMSQSEMILTDSGGIQEEAPSLGKPVLVMRDTTERPEAILSGTVKLVGTTQEKIVQSVVTLLENPDAYEKMAQAHNPYGEGEASEKIVEFLKNNER
jgi:UDP-N-acetylglucosamine 2-epimerase (non-hydrolysing)